MGLSRTAASPGAPRHDRPGRVGLAHDERAAEAARRHLDVAADPDPLRRAGRIGHVDQAGRLRLAADGRLDARAARPWRPRRRSATRGSRPSRRAGRARRAPPRWWRRPRPASSGRWATGPRRHGTGRAAAGGGDPWPRGPTPSARRRPRRRRRPRDVHAAEPSGTAPWGARARRRTGRCQRAPRRPARAVRWGPDRSLGVPPQSPDRDHDSWCNASRVSGILPGYLWRSSLMHSSSARSWHRRALRVACVLAGRRLGRRRPRGPDRPARHGRGCGLVRRPPFRRRHGLLGSHDGRRRCGSPSDGRAFVAEKRGIIKEFDSVDDTSATQVLDIRTDRPRLLGPRPAEHRARPRLPQRPPVHLRCTTSTTRRRVRRRPSGTTPAPTRPGATTDGCVVRSKLDRYTVNLATNVADPASRLNLIGDGANGEWCQQFPSHAGGALAFDRDGQLS